jgi:hypothetical protein
MIHLRHYYSEVLPRIVLEDRLGGNLSAIKPAIRLMTAFITFVPLFQRHERRD